MSQCVPSWDLDDNHAIARYSNSTAPDVHMSDYEVAELTWENGQLAMHGLRPARAPFKPLTPKYNTWDKPRANGTLESIVNQATRVPYLKVSLHGGEDEIVPCLHQRRAAADALVPCSKGSSEDHQIVDVNHVMDSTPGVGGSRLGGCSTGVGSCTVPAGTRDDDVLVTRKRTRMAAGRVPVTSDWSSKEQSASASATFGRESQYVTFDSYEKDLGVAFTSTSLGSPENTSSTKFCTRATSTADDHDSVCHSTPQREGMGEDKKQTGKSSVSNKRSRAAAIHNQSERKRRDKINQRMKTLQKLVPNSSKTDKASMLDEVIDYLKQLQAQVHMMNRMNMAPPMMLPMAMQQQLQMSMMAPSMGMGMGVMDINSFGRHNIAGISPVMPNPFMNMTSWDGSGERIQQAACAMPDPLSLFLACQPQPMAMDVYSRLAAIYQQMQQPPASGSKT